MKQKNIPQRLGIWALIIAAILMIPYLTSAPWTSFDFILAATVLFTLATIYELATKNMKSLKSRLMIGAGILILIVLIMGWAATGSD